MAESKKRNRHEPRTFIGRFMVYYFVPQYANNVMGLVYIGAAILIIIVGLRGLGASVANNPLVPQFLLEGDRIGIQYVMIALYIEFVMLFILAFVTFFTPEETHHKDEGKGETAAAAESKININAKEIRDSVDILKHLTEDEMQMIDGYLERFDKISEKINEINRKNLAALSDMKETLKSSN